MERKITHYVVKPEHIDHYYRLTGMDEARDFKQDSPVYKTLTEAKVLALWCTPYYEKQRVNGWYNVYGLSLSGPYKTKEQAIAYSNNNPACRGQILIDQEIE